MDENENISVTWFRNYLRINTMHPNPNYEPAVAFLVNLAQQIGLRTQVVNIIKNPAVIMTLLGEQPHLPSILLNSHMDVVPVFPEHWKYDPFSAHKDEQGNIYARGAQDMKCVGIQYVEAVRRLKTSGQSLLRTIHILFVPDEELSDPLDGMKSFVKTKEFKNLNVGFVLDEGIASVGPVYQVFYGERLKWWLHVKCTGNPGHGSKFIENTAAEKFQNVVNKFLSFREEQRQKLKNDEKLDLGDVITINMTMISGGVQVNVVPSELHAEFDIRVPPTVDLDKFQATVEKWCTDVPGVELQWLAVFKNKNVTSIDDENIWWKAFSTALKSMKLEYVTKIFTGATDAHYLRELGLPAIGFSPMVNTPQLLHDHNEFLNEAVFLKGVDVYVNLISTVANVAI